MTSSLSAPDLKALRAVNDALLDPLSHDTIAAWLLEVCARFETLCHASTSFAGYSLTTGEAAFVSRAIPGKFLDRLGELSFLDPGSLRSSDAAVEKVMGTMRHRVSSVAMSTDLIDPAGPARIPVDQLKESPIYRDVACPLGVPGSALLFHSGASGEFMIHAAFPEIDHRPFGETTRALLSLLLPGLAASIGALARLGDARRAVGSLLDALQDGATIFDSSGRKRLARNAALQTLFQQEPDAAALDDRIRQSAVAAAHSDSRPCRVLEKNTEALASGWSSPSGVPYRSRAIRLASGSVTDGESILVLVQRVTPLLPDHRELMQRFGLTPREAQVARLLTLGFSDRQIAAELRLSPHTVRHHAEAVFLKIGVTSRKALLLHLGAPALPASQ